jgi:hypothetical protein
LVSGASREAIPASVTLRTPIASRVVRDWWPVVLLLSVAPLLQLLLRRRQPASARVAASGSTELELRRVLGQAADATPRRIESALRRRGVDRHAARQVHHWLEAMERHRWAADHPPPVDDGPVADVIAQLRRGAGRVMAVVLLAGTLALPAAGQWDEALARYRDRDAAGAARLFAEVVREHPASPDAWLDLGAARWLAGDDVGSAAAWLSGLRVAPRDGRLRFGLESVPNLPPEVRAMAPLIPLSRDELLVATLVGWLLGGLAWRRHRRAAWVVLGVMAGCAILASSRTVAAARDTALVRGGDVLRVSPVVTAPVLSPVAAWAVAQRERREGDWWLVRMDDTRRGWIPAYRLAPVSRLD